MMIAPFTFFCVPETKDCTLEESDEMFHKMVSVFEFKSYVCTGEAVVHSTAVDEKLTETTTTTQVEHADIKV